MDGETHRNFSDLLTIDGFRFSIDCRPKPGSVCWEIVVHQRTGRGSAFRVCAIEIDSPVSPGHVRRLIRGHLEKLGFWEAPFANLKFPPLTAEEIERTARAVVSAASPEHMLAYKGEN